MGVAISGQIMPWFTINEGLSGAVTASTNIPVGGISAVAFSVDVDITIGSLGSTFPLTAHTPLGIDTSTENIQVSTGAFMFAMKGD